MAKWLLLALILYTFSSELDAARILAVIPTPSISHQVVFRPLTQELARRGHEVTVITTDPVFTKDNSPVNFTEIDVHDVSYKVWMDTILQHEVVFGKKDSLYQQIDVLGEIVGKLTEVHMKNEEVQHLINTKNTDYYDLLILEECAKPYLIFSHIFKAPVILVSSFSMMLDADQIVGVPGHIFYYPTIMHQRLYNLTFWEKIEEMYKHFNILHKWHASHAKQFKVLQTVFGDDLPSYSELNKNIDMMFLNIHPMWSNNQPLPPNVINIWGIHKKPEKELPKDLLSYLDHSKNGVIYLSFGTNVSSSMLPPQTIQVLIKVLSKLPYDVLWKWELDDLPGKSKNIRIAKWLPQSDLLRHPKIKLFITQGGLQSTDEAITAGVPLIGIPMLGDQWYNVELYEYHKIGVRLDLETLSQDILDKAIKSVISDKSHRDNVVRLGTLMRDQPEGGLERAVWWTEYVLRHGGAKHLKAQGANKTWTEYYEIQFISILAALGLFIFVISAYMLHLILGTIMHKTKIKVS